MNLCNWYRAQIHAKLIGQRDQRFLSRFLFIIHNSTKKKINIRFVRWTIVAVLLDVQYWFHSSERRRKTKNISCAWEWMCSIVSTVSLSSCSCTPSANKQRSRTVVVVIVVVVRIVLAKYFGRLRDTVCGRHSSSAHIRFHFPIRIVTSVRWVLFSMPYTIALKHADAVESEEAGNASRATRKNCSKINIL